MATTKICRNCKREFVIDENDSIFYGKIKVPAPTWCWECRMLRRFLFYNDRRLFRRKDDANGKEIFAGYPANIGAKIYDRDHWWSDKWDPMLYGRDYDFSQNFFEQFRELLYAVPWPAKSTLFTIINSEYCNRTAGAKNSYLCFWAGDIENSAYVVRGITVKEGFDLLDSRHSELCYEDYMADEAYRVFFSVNCENCIDVWFSKNLLGCNHCFGCVNLRNKSYHIFNKRYTKEEYQKYLSQLDLGSYKTISELKKQAQEFWLKFPMRFTLAIRVTNSTGEHIEKSKNLKYCYGVHEGENLGYSQFIEPPAADSYDYTSWGYDSSLIYECLESGEECYNLKFCWECWPVCEDLEYSAFCRSSTNLIGCVGLQKKQYCIFNKQYGKDDYFKLREKIVQQMDEKPYVDKEGRVYKYGEFFPTEFSPYAYNETLVQDFFPLSKEEAEKRGYRWREPELREYKITLQAADLPDNIKDANGTITKEIIGCQSCGRAYRIIPIELAFLKRIGLPLPRLCPECRFRERFKFVNPPKFWRGKCQCAGITDDRQIYKNGAAHFHGEKHCSNEFETSYAPGRPEIIYCEKCYQQEAA